MSIYKPDGTTEHYLSKPDNAVMEYNMPLIETAEALIAAIRNIRANWEHGDLAGALTLACELADECEDAIENNCADE